MTPTILTFPAVAQPAKQTWKLQRFDARYTSPLSGTFQDVQRAGANWQCQLEWNVLSYSDSQILAAWADQMSQAGTRTLLPNFAYKPRGQVFNVGINGAGQTGTSLSINGFPANSQNVVMVGDMFTVSDGTQHQLLRVTSNANADGSGNAVINFVPALRFSPTNSSYVFFGIAPTTNPTIYKSDWQGNQLQYATPRTNLLTNSNNFSAASWTNTNCTITAAATTGPDGTTSGTKLAVANVSNPNIQNNDYTVPSPAPANISCSVWLKAGNITQAILNSYQNGVGGVAANWVILSGPGAVSGSGVGTVTGLSTTQWTRVGFTTTGALTSGSQFNLYIKPQTATPAIGDYIYCAFSQMELGTVDTSYIATVGSTVTVTDYTLAGNQITFASAPANAAALTCVDSAGTAFNFGTGTGSATQWTLGFPAAYVAFAKPDSSISYTAPNVGALSLSLVEDINL